MPAEQIVLSNKYIPPSPPSLLSYPAVAFDIFTAFTTPLRPGQPLHSCPQILSRGRRATLVPSFCFSMGGSAEYYGGKNLQNALDIARNSETGVPTEIATYLELALQNLWRKLYDRPNSYVFTREEYSLFNYFQARIGSNEIARRAIQRFWDQYMGDPTDLEDS